jgi:hypothetical protein
MLQITFHCSRPQETAFCTNSIVECTLLESNKWTEMIMYYAAQTSSFTPATILLHTLIWQTHVLIFQVAIFPRCFSKFYEPQHCMIYFFPHIWLTTLPHLHANCLETWEPKLPGSLRACPGLQRDCFALLSLCNRLGFLFILPCPAHRWSS